jgi:hypothetical protein
MTRWLALLALLLPAPAFAQATVVTSCGGASLTAGTPHFVTVDVNGRSCQSGGGGVTPPPVSSPLLDLGPQVGVGGIT